MELIRGLHNLRPSHHGCVATIGNFDGVHLGHQAVIGQLAEKADALGLPAAVITITEQIENATGVNILSSLSSGAPPAAPAKTAEPDAETATPAQ